MALDQLVINFLCCSYLYLCYQLHLGILYLPLQVVNLMALCHDLNDELILKVMIFQSVMYMTIIVGGATGVPLSGLCNYALLIIPVLYMLQVKIYAVKKVYWQFKISLCIQCYAIFRLY